jgi:IMP dehydrogenase
MDIAAQAAEVRRVKKFEAGMVKDPITVTPETTVRELIEITKANNISGVPVVKDGKVVGIVTGRDTRFETNLEQPVSNIMTPQERLVTVKEGDLKKNSSLYKSIALKKFWLLMIAMLKRFNYRN